MIKKALLASVMTIAVCLSLIAGSTFALFATEDVVNIVVSSAGVNMEANLELNSLKTYWCGNETDVAGRFRDGGTATIEGGELLLTNMVPGDKAEVQISLVNSSKISVAYRVVVVVEGKLGEVLETEIVGADVTNGSAVQGDHSGWTLASPAVRSSTLAPITVSVEMPVWVDNLYANAEGRVILKVQAIQQSGAGMVLCNGRSYENMAAALASVEAGQAAELEISGSVKLDAQALGSTNAASVSIKGLEYAELTIDSLEDLNNLSVRVTLSDLTLVDACSSYTADEWNDAIAVLRNNVGLNSVTYVGNGVTEQLQS